MPYVEKPFGVVLKRAFPQRHAPHTFDDCMGYALSCAHLVDIDHNLMNFQLAMVIKIPHVPFPFGLVGAGTKLIIRGGIAMQTARNIIPFNIAANQDHSGIRWEDVSHLGKFEKMVPNQYVIYPEERVQYLYYIKEGRGRCFISWPDGNEHTLYFLEKGAIIGEALLDNTPSQWGVVTLEHSIVYRFSYQQIMKIIAEYPEIALSIIRSCLVKKKLLTKHIQDLTFKKADAKIAEVLYAMAEHYGESNQGFVIPINQNDLAELVGVSRVTISKVLSRFQKHGVVVTRRGSVLVLNKEKLLKLAFEVTE